MTHSFQLNYKPLPNDEKNLRTGLIAFLVFSSLLLGYNTYQDNCTSVNDVERVGTGDTVDGFKLGTGDTVDGYVRSSVATDRYGNTSTASRSVNGEEEYLNSQNSILEYNLPFSTTNSESQLQMVMPIMDTLKH